jgi:zinc transporter, ZIP family
VSIFFFSPCCRFLLLSVFQKTIKIQKHNNITAIAAGMMIAASYSLFAEGCTYNDPHDQSSIAAEYRTILGALLGLAFILATKKFLDQYEDLKVGGLGGTDARKALLIFFVMTLHSFSEGVGVGVSFGGLHGSQLGTFISASLAMHNVPEGLAIAVVLLPRGVSILTAVVWAIATSLPQPLMAVPAFLFVHSFIPILPVGLGFAGGAMAWVAFFELLMEAIEETNIITTASVAILSMIGMLLMQSALDD